MESDTSETSRRVTGQPAQQDARETGSPRISSGPATDATPANIDRTSWIQDDDSFRTVMYMSATGKHPVIGGPTIPLYRPTRFRSASPLRSMVILLLVVGLIIGIPVGVIMADRATSNLQLPGLPGIPGISATATPVTTPTITVTPTRTPIKKK
jgi:hypothetical protein